MEILSKSVEKQQKEKIINKEEGKHPALSPVFVIK
jgi:hypothetical protein